MKTNLFKTFILIHYSQNSYVEQIRGDFKYPQERLALTLQILNLNVKISSLTNFGLRVQQS